MANLEFVILLDIRQSTSLPLSQEVVRSADCFMTFLLWLIETHIQELEEELKLLKNHSQPNIVVSNKRREAGRNMDVISEEAGALATAEGPKSLNSSVI
ncbi:hypothetical protein YC2023_067160 [Brassica napus]